MEESELGLAADPALVWTPTKNKSAQTAAKEAGIDSSAAYKFNKQWKENGGTTLPGYETASELKSKQNNVTLNDEHSQFLKAYVEGHPTCIVKDATEELCEAFDGWTINQSSVYRHITNKLRLHSHVPNQRWPNITLKILLKHAVNLSSNYWRTA
ncbi:hypothetical protein BX666DRAFT_2031265 [Dichotomocladium elegans]|nr:hypothetical protein BX666DRAFT_2031265 [Dichotomocladium elegans]